MKHERLSAFSIRFSRIINCVRDTIDNWFFASTTEWPTAITSWAMTIWNGRALKSIGESECDREKE